MATTLRLARAFTALSARSARNFTPLVALRPNNTGHYSLVRHATTSSSESANPSGDDKKQKSSGHSANSRYNIFFPEKRQFSTWPILGGFIGFIIFAYAYNQNRKSIERMMFRQDDSSEDSKKNAKKSTTAAPSKPVIIDGLPESIDYLLVGGGTASHSAMRAIRGHNAKAKVLIISEENYTPYMRPALSKELWFSEPELIKDFKFKWWNGRERSIFYELDELYIPVNELANRETGGVSVAKGVKVTRLDPEQRIAFLNNGQTVKYEKCLLAPGGHPKNLPVFENASPEVQDRVTLFRTADDFKRLESLSHSAKRIVIVGGGFLGSELACALGRRALIGKDKSKKVIQVFPEAGILGKVLPEYLSKWTTERVTEEGVQVMPGNRIESVTFNGKCVDLKLSSGETVQADHIVVAVGLEPDTRLARSSGLEVDDKTGGYLVNSELEARSNIWVAGDASCFYDMKLGRRRVEHHDHAIVSGRLAGKNMVGSGKPYTHQSMFWSDLGPEVAFEAIGIVDSSLPTVAVFAKVQPGDDDSSDDKKTNDSVNDSVDKTDKSKQAENNKQETKKDEEEKSAENEEMTRRLRSPRPGDDYQKGVVFYLRDDVIVGIVMWNLFNRLTIARRLLREDKRYDDFNEVAKLFNVHSND